MRAESQGQVPDHLGGDEFRPPLSPSPALRAPLAAPGPPASSLQPGPIPEVQRGEPLQQSHRHARAGDQQQRHRNIVVALVVVQLRVGPQHVQDDVHQLLLQDLALLFRHAWGGRGVRGRSCTPSPSPPPTQPLPTAVAEQRTAAGKGVEPHCLEALQGGILFRTGRLQLPVDELGALWTCSEACSMTSCSM